MSYGIRAIAFANGMRCPHEDEWLESFDHEAQDGQGYGVFTPDPAKAMRFATAAEAMLFWGKRSIVKPTRPDGRPNKPLTALTAAIEQLP